MIQLNWDDVYNCRPTFGYDHIALSDITITRDEVIDFGAPVGLVPVDGLMIPELMKWQFAMCVFMATRRVYALNTYFPLTRTLDKDGQKDFYQLAGHILCQHSFTVSRVLEKQASASPIAGIRSEHNPDLREDFAVNPQNLAIPHEAQIAFFVACHIAELFFYRRDILERLLKTPFEVRLATSAEAFKEDGGVAGGNYDPERGRIQMMLSRLFEGYNGKSPGVVPFLHEFGHLLDHFDTAEAELGKSHGTLPGMRPSDAALYDAEVHDLFLKGKRLEWERYMKLSADGYREGDPFPIGHPYVFQNDTEFIAGYLEMFFRNPHYFAAQNPDLYESFRLTFRQDPRQCCDADFPFYIQQNQTYYRGLQRPPKPRLTI